MYERDYLTRLLIQLAEGIRKSWWTSKKDDDFESAAMQLEDAISTATDFDGPTLLSLEPESMAGILQVSGTDPHVIEYIARSLLLEARYLRNADNEAMADLRERQGLELASAYDIDLGDACLGPEEFEALFERDQVEETLSPSMIES